MTTKRPNISRPGALLAICALITGWWMWSGYLRSDATFIIGLGVVPASLVVRRPGRGSWRFALWAALCVGLGLAVPSRTFHFMALAFTAAFVYENERGKINEAPLLTAFLLTAVVKTMSIVLGFSLRLELSKYAAAALRFVDKNAAADGNIILYKGQSFSVDPACMGLQMVEVSFLFCFFMLGLFERRGGRYLPWPVLAGAVAAVGFLNLLFNQLRIILLVLFNVLPDNPVHDVAGLAGLALYVFVPTWFGLQWLFRRFAKQASPEETALPVVPPSHTKKAVQIVLLLFLLWFAATETGAEESHVHGIQAIVPRGIPGSCAAETLTDGVVKYADDSLLIYVKPVRGWYSTEHTPLICWRGSGYEFGRVREEKTGESAVYIGTLEKTGEPLLYTAWWFDNGKVRTIEQARWRALDAGGAPGFCLVNVTARDEAVLRRQVQKMWQN